MRCFLVICLFIAFGCNNSGSKKSSPELKQTIVTGVKTVAIELTIQGMTCTGCEQTIQTGISSIKGVKQVKATFKNGKAYIEYQPDVADTILMKEKILASGYHVSGIRSIPMDSLRTKL